MKTIMSLIISFVSAITPMVSVYVPSDSDAESYVVYPDVSYGDFERNTMDIYLPEKTQDDRDFGALMFIHGGSWTSGDKSSEANLCRQFAKKGYITASINYHYIDFDNPVSTNMDDIAAAISKLKSVCSENGYKVAKLALHGFSSGAHLATLFSYSCPERSAIPLAFVVNMVGPSDFNSATWKEWHYDENTGPGLALLLYGVRNLSESVTDIAALSPQKAQEIINSVSPVYYINESSIPTICGYAGDGKDGIVPTKNKTITFETLKRNNVSCDLFTFENSNHLLLGDTEVRQELYKKVEEYCKIYFGY